MQQWTNETQVIINAHNKDFNVGNYATKIKTYGGYDAYVKSLGGVFAKEHGRSKAPTTISEYHQCIEYVMGLMAIWGFDYYNGKTYWRWGQGSGNKATADAFRTSGKGKCKGGDIKKLCTTTNIVTTNCNYGVDTLLRHMKLMKTNCDRIQTWAKSYGKPVSNKKDLKPGDIVHFFGKSLTRSKPTTWKGKNWHHVAIVHSVDKANKKIWLADFGNRYIKQRKPLHYMTIDTSAKGTGEYGSYYWAAIHAFNFKDDTAGTTPTTTIPQTPVVTTPTPAAYETPMPEIKKGSKGKAVKIWQIIVGAKVDGNFGDKTVSATKSFQKKKSLTQDGIVGAKTWAAGLKSVK